MIFIDKCFKKPTPHTPVWIMRQAGRYLSEYRAIRKQAGSFLNLCHNPELSAEVTIQPIDILGVDAAILFSDILVLPNEMGMDLEFVTQKGPVIHNPVTSLKDIAALDENAANKLTYTYETIKLVREKLPTDKALIGFAGAPWTVATYMIEGSGSKNYFNSKKMLYSDPQTLHKLLEVLTKSTHDYLENQIKAGVNAVMLFDSWASMIEPARYIDFSFSYMLQIAESLKSKYPHIPVILFPKGVGASLETIANLNGNFDVFGVDWSTPITLAKKHLSPRYVLQGNVEPFRLYNQEASAACVRSVHERMDGAHHIFNLGHGITPDVPVENVKYFVDQVHQVSKVS